MDAQLLDVENLVDRNVGSKETVKRLLRKGELKGAKIGRRWKVREEDLKEYLAQKFGPEQRQVA